MRLATLFLGGLVAAIPVACLAQATDATVVDPDVHRVVLENDYVRVFDARASKGAKSAMHTHPPMVLVGLDAARFRITPPDGNAVIFDMDPGKTVWINGTQHSWELMSGELHAIGVEIKSAQGKEAPPAREVAPDNATVIDPEAHHVLFENPHVRVYEGRATIGHRSPMHSHVPSAYVSLDWMRLKQTQADGKQSIVDFAPGQVMWLPDAATHSWEVIAGSVRVIGIEVKAAQASGDGS